MQRVWSMTLAHCTRSARTGSAVLIILSGKETRIYHAKAANGPLKSGCESSDTARAPSLGARAPSPAFCPLLRDVRSVRAGRPRSQLEMPQFLGYLDRSHWSIKPLH